MKAQTRHALTSALFEAFFVVLGVILALAANEWRQNVADREQGREALRSVVEEIRTNQGMVQEALDYHAGRMEMIGEAREGSAAPSARDFPRGFVSPARVFKTAWLAASETGAMSHIPYETVLELSRVYSHQDRYEAQARLAGELIYTELFRGGTDAILENHVNLASLIGTFRYREMELIDLYAAALAALEPVQ